MFSEWRWVLKWILCFHSPGVWAEKLKDQSVNCRCVLVFPGADGEMAARQPCWSLGICVLPASLVLCVFIIVGFYLCTGEWTVVCLRPLPLSLDTRHFLCTSLLQVAVSRPKLGVKGKRNVFRLEAGWVLFNKKCVFVAASPPSGGKFKYIYSSTEDQCERGRVESTTIILITNNEFF